MNSTPNFDEWTREKKEEFLNKRVLEMKLKNEKIMQRHAEVEQDRLNAEEKNSAVTNTTKVHKKERSPGIHERELSPYTCELPPNWHAREWDRGKPDKEHWKSPEHHSSFKSYRSNYYDRSADRWKDTSWHNSSRNECSDYYRHDRGADNVRNNRKIRGNHNYKHYETDQHCASSSSNHYKSPKRSRGVGYRSGESHRKSYSSYSDERFKKTSYPARSNSRKKHVHQGRSSSSKSSDSENISNLRISSIKASSLWQSDKIKEDENKQTMVQNWVECVNETIKNFSSEEKKSPIKAYSKFDRFKHSDNSSDDEFVSNLSTSRREDKNQESSSYPYKKEFTEKKFGNKGRMHNNPVSDASKQNENPRKGYKNKRNPQCSSTGSGKNEKFSKQGRFENKDLKSSTSKEKFVKSKVVVTDTFDAIWSNKKQNNFKSKNKYSSNDDGWGPADDGLWGNAEQSDIKWKLSDDESDSQGTPKQNIKCDRWETENVTSCNVAKRENATADNWEQQNIPCSSVVNKTVTDDGWGDETSYGAEKNRNATDDGWGDYPSEKTENQKNDTHFIEDKNLTGTKVTNVKFSGNLSTSKPEISDYQQDFSSALQKSSHGGMNETSPSEIIEQFKHSVRISDECNNSNFVNNVLSEKSLNASDDGGWSTVSEEGEIHSEDEKVYDVKDRCNMENSAVK